METNHNRICKMNTHNEVLDGILSCDCSKAFFQNVELIIEYALAYDIQLSYEEAVKIANMGLKTLEHFNKVA